MQGELTVASTLGCGSTFTLRLKRFSPELAGAHQLAAAQQMLPVIPAASDPAQAPQEH